MEPLAVDVKEAARLTSLSPYTIRALIRKGQIKVARIGRRVVIPIQSIERLLRKGSAVQRTSD